MPPERSQRGPAHTAFNVLMYTILEGYLSSSVFVPLTRFVPFNRGVMPSQFLQVESSLYEGMSKELADLAEELRFACGVRDEWQVNSWKILPAKKPKK